MFMYLNKIIQPYIILLYQLDSQKIISLNTRLSFRIEKYISLVRGS